MIYSMSQQLLLPSDCRYVSADRCSVKLMFWYDSQTYSVRFTSKTLPMNKLDYNNRKILTIETAKKRFFTYHIHHTCKTTNDCAQHFAEQKISQMRNRSYNLSDIYSSLQRLLLDQSTLSENLACFNMNDDIQQCSIPGLSASCHIIDDLIRHKFYRRLCLHNQRISASINIYDSNNFAIMIVKCNRMFCNGPLTITALKQVLQHYRIIDANGRLTGNSLQIHLSRYLFLAMAFLLIQMRTNI